MERPSKLLLCAEMFRAIYEYALAYLLETPLQHISPSGDGHPVLLIPGLGGNEKSTNYLRNYLETLGYDARSWGLGRNLGPRHGIQSMTEILCNKVESIFTETGREVSIIGWSLGGIYSREVAKHCPSMIRQVMTLGTPFKLKSGGINVGPLYEFLSKDTSYKDPEIISKISEVPPVPFTSFYSKSDGVVHWTCSLEDPAPEVQNVEIPGASHLGIGHNPIALFIIANRLSYTKETWAPFTLRS